MLVFLQHLHDHGHDDDGDDRTAIQRVSSSTSSSGTDDNDMVMMEHHLASRARGLRRAELRHTSASMAQAEEGVGAGDEDRGVTWVKGGCMMMRRVVGVVTIF